VVAGERYCGFEETHRVNKDISLWWKMVQYVGGWNGSCQGYFLPKQRGGGSNAEKRHSAGAVLKPGELLMVDDPEAVINQDGTFGQPGRFYPVTRSQLNYRVRGVANGPALLLRPVTEYRPVRPSVPSTQSRMVGRSIELRAVQRLPYKDSERVKSVEGVELLRTHWC